MATFVTRHAGIELAMPQRLVDEEIEFAPAGQNQRPLPQMIHIGDEPIKRGSFFAPLSLTRPPAGPPNLRPPDATDFASERNFLQQIALQMEMNAFDANGELAVERLEESGKSFLKIARMCREGDEPLSAVHAFFRSGVIFAMMKDHPLFAQAEEAFSDAYRTLFGMKYYAASAMAAELAADVRDVIEACARPKMAILPAPASYNHRAYAAIGWTNAPLIPADNYDSEIVFRALHNAWRSDHRGKYSSYALHALSDRLAQSGRAGEAAEHILRLGLMYATRSDLTAEDLIGVSDAMLKAKLMLEQSGARRDLIDESASLGNMARSMAQ